MTKVFWVLQKIGGWNNKIYFFFSEAYLSFWATLRPKDEYAQPQKAQSKAMYTELLKIKQSHSQDTNTQYLSSDPKKNRLNHKKVQSKAMYTELLKSSGPAAKTLTPNLCPPTIICHLILAMGSPYSTLGDLNGSNFLPYIKFFVCQDPESYSLFHSNYFLFIH